MVGSIIKNFADVLVLVLFFGGSIFIHELGHFLVALKFGFVVDTFSIGFGPAIWKKKIKGIEFKVCWFPLGGYVALPQLDPTGMATVQGVTEDGEEIRRELPAVTPLSKIAVSCAGAVGNIILAIVFACVIWVSPGAVTYKDAPIVASVESGSKAYISGLRAGDQIVAVNGKPVATWYDVNMELLLIGKTTDVDLTVTRGAVEKKAELSIVKEDGVKLPAMKGITRQVSTRCVLHEIQAGSVAEKAGLKANDVVKSLDGKPVADAEDFIKLVKGRAGDELSVVVVRDGKELPLKVTPSYDKERDRAMVGAVVGTMVISLPWMQEKKPLAQLKADAGGITRLLKALVNHKESAHAASGLGGPVMIFAALWGSIKISIFNAIGFLRFLNVNLAILNMLPIPVLDGGHIMFSLWEMVTRRKVNEKVVNALVNIFAILLIGTFLILTTRDVGTVFPKTKKLFSWAHKEEVATNVVNSASNTNRTEEVSPQ